MKTNWLIRFWFKIVAAFLIIAPLLLLAAQKSSAQAVAPTPSQPIAEKQKSAPLQKTENGDETPPPKEKFVPPPYNIMRFDEDFSYLRDASKRVDVFDR